MNAAQIAQYNANAHEEGTVESDAEIVSQLVQRLRKMQQANADLRCKWDEAQLELSTLRRAVQTMDQDARDRQEQLKRELAQRDEQVRSLLADKSRGVIVAEKPRSSAGRAEYQPYNLAESAACRAVELEREAQIVALRSEATKLAAQLRDALGRCKQLTVLVGEQKQAIAYKNDRISALETKQRLSNYLLAQCESQMKELTAALSSSKKTSPEVKKTLLEQEQEICRLEGAVKQLTQQLSSSYEQHSAKVEAQRRMLEEKEARIAQLEDRLSASGRDLLHGNSANPAAAGDASAASCEPQGEKAGDR